MAEKLRDVVAEIRAKGTTTHERSALYVAKAIRITNSAFIRAMRDNALGLESCLRLAHHFGLAPTRVLTAADKDEDDRLLRALYGEPDAPLSADDRALVALDAGVKAALVSALTQIKKVSVNTSVTASEESLSRAAASSHVPQERDRSSRTGGHDPDVASPAQSRRVGTHVAQRIAESTRARAPKIQRPDSSSASGHSHHRKRDR